MVGSDVLQFGHKSVAWAVVGVIFVLTGVLFAVGGAGILWVVLETASLPVENIIFGGIFLLLGIMALAVGVMTIAQRRNFMIVLTDHSIQIGALLNTAVIPYKDIRAVKDSADAILLVVANRMFSFPIDHGYFTDVQERHSFIDGLSNCPGSA